MTHETIETPRKDQTGVWKSNLRDYGLLGSLLVIIALFEYLTGGVLLAPANITNLILQNSYIVIMALGMLLIIVGGNIDLSVGSIVGFIGAIAATMMVDYKLPWVPVVGLSLVAGGLIGAAQGYFVAYAKIPSFIVTLGGMLVFRGLTGNILLGQFVGPFPRDFQSISSGFIPDVVSAPLLVLFGDDLGANFRWTSMLIGLAGAAILIFTSARRWRHARAHTMETEPLALFIGKNAVFTVLIVAFCYLLASYRGLPNVLIIMGALILLYMFVTQRMTIGRRIYALGGNRMAAQLSGIRTERLIFLTFVNMGALAGLAGLIVAARLNSATPSAGNSFELDVIAACFIGGASAAGGVGKVTGVVIGAFIIGVMNNGMSIMGIGIDYQQVIKGLVLLGAVCLDVYNKNKAA